MLNCNNNLSEAIARTIAFFDIFDFPLTAFEIWLYLWRPESEKEIAVSAVIEILENDELLKKKTGKKEGFYFLSGREEILEERRRRYNYADRKFRRARRAAKLFRFIPWIKMVALGNLIGGRNLKKEGDIDLFIISEPGKIWLSRFWAAGLAALLGWRPRGAKTKDRICLSFFAAADSLKMESLLLKEDGRLFDPYFCYWLAFLTPLYDPDNFYDKLIAENLWLKNFLPGWRPLFCQNKIFPPALVWRRGFTFILGRGGELVKKIQLKIMAKEIKELMNKDEAVVVNDQILKFHTNDKREEYKKRWREKIDQYEKIS